MQMPLIAFLLYKNIEQLPIHVHVCNGRVHRNAMQCNGASVFSREIEKAVAAAAHTASTLTKTPIRMQQCNSKSILQSMWSLLCWQDSLFHDFSVPLSLSLPRTSSQPMNPSAMHTHMLLPYFSRFDFLRLLLLLFRDRAHIASW